MCPVAVFACARECACDGSLRAAKLSVTGNWALNYKGYRQNHVHQAEEGRTRAGVSLPAELPEMETVWCVMTENNRK